MRDVRAGLVLDELDVSLQQLVQQIQRTNKAGSNPAIRASRSAAAAASVQRSPAPQASPGRQDPQEDNGPRPAEAATELSER